ncbi:DUF4097 domain-containing protein [Halalkalibacter sp. APA_J-10(15)]|uniref:DUF4097 family beta strand repeat-containing protein n=1 Tax=unclassified Halalkalibacter TaxID=2893063 RepID=UPI001FF54E09|nr:DUF4097 domain-containing protein [Halalkalibacter sp. APA_J-10(15)]MCK0472985.1 DUF4097 domain-containing protein [Halalkalibacter sp. APA_J-10(15)]
MEERKMILKMIEDGKITAEEGVKLLEAIEDKEPIEPNQEAKSEVTTKVNWDEGDSYRERARHSRTSTTNLFTSFIDSAIQKIKDVDLDFNFGASFDVDHIFQHREHSPTSIDVSLENGSITFQPWDEKDVRVECTAKVYRAKDLEEARRIFLDECSFRISEQRMLFHTKTKSIKVQTVIYVPRREFEHVKLYTFNGQIIGERIEIDTFDINAMNGSLKLTDVQSKKLIAETVNGAIDLTQSKAELVDVKTLNGAITIDGQVQDLDAESVNGSITYHVGRLDESGYADLKAATGSIHLVVPKSLRVEGKLKTNVGGFSVGMYDHEKLEEKKEFAQKQLTFIGNQQSSPRVKVNALTNTGSIVVKDQVN